MQVIDYGTAHFCEAGQHLHSKVRLLWWPQMVAQLLGGSEHSACLAAWMWMAWHTKALRSPWNP